MYRGAPVLSPSAILHPDSSSADFGIYGIEQNDRYLDLNSIEPSLLYPATAQQQNFIYGICKSSNSYVTDSTNQIQQNRCPRRMVRRKRTKRDPNEPKKPVSAYALFFRDTQSVIKGRSPSASFGEVSKIVASMWDSLDNTAKNLYKQRTEIAKRDYLKNLAVYRAQQISQSEAGNCGPVDEHSAMHSNLPNLATDANCQKQPSQKLEEYRKMTLASLMASPPSGALLSYYSPKLNAFKVGKSAKLLRGSSFDSVPLIIECVGLACGLIACVAMHCLLKRIYESDDDGPTIHHLIHDKIYNSQLLQFLQRQERHNVQV
ncbi:unnamed protein product [Gongylonema pulchrum]|uniref:HMG box domain-containing protein n=1 Tax=Gongylonema pulchrum TaxID=637853 RepID=A0A183CUS9_9BILA|nr:unnamed protein product [Gongylonema pulchrum]